MPDGDLLTPLNEPGSDDRLLLGLLLLLARLYRKHPEVFEHLHDD